MKENVKRRILFSAAAVWFLALLVLELFRDKIFTSEMYGKYMYSIGTRFLGGFACMVFIYLYSTKSILSPKITLKSFALFLPCMAVAINNFPFITYFSGEAVIDAQPLRILTYAVVCLGVGLFEEMAFRGCIFTAILQRRKRRWSDVFWSIVFSSAIFGAMHVVNIFSGASPIGVILQVGYSFLIGGMCSVILIKTSNIWYCVILHAVYNFAGGVVTECGRGLIWTAPTVILTAAVAVCVAVYVIWLLVRIKPEDIREFLEESECDCEDSQAIGEAEKNDKL